MISTTPVSRPIIPNDVIDNIIFCDLSLHALALCARVCKTWKEIATKHINAFTHERAFGPKEWYTHFGSRLRNVPRLPVNIVEILNAPCPFWPNKKVYETHVLCLVPQTVDGQPLTLRLLGELIQKPLQGHATKYQYLELGEYPDPSAPKSHWALLTQDVVGESRSKTFEEQQALIASFSQKAKVPYEVTTILDANVCILMEYVRTGARLYSDKPYTNTRCQEEWNADRQLVVGGFAPSGLCVVSNFGDRKSIGVAGWRKF